ncbi:DUF3438 family protein, partial [Xenorhabdus sp. Vera]|uniref:DUF3438 family protein n=1 Tax=Xenorhabdus koppenhoeferi TaxID=351659 RepID=UPI0019C7F466
MISQSRYLCFLAGLFSLLWFSLGAKADELMKWERIPLSIALKIGQERIIFADRNVRV